MGRVHRFRSERGVSVQCKRDTKFPRRPAMPILPALSVFYLGKVVSGWLGCRLTRGKPIHLQFAVNPTQFHGIWLFPARILGLIAVR